MRGRTNSAQEGGEEEGPEGPGGIIVPAEGDGGIVITGSIARCGDAGGFPGEVWVSGVYDGRNGSGRNVERECADGEECENGFGEHDVVREDR